MKGRQVRLDPEIAAALEAIADEEGGSVAQHANRKLRRALGLHRDDTDVDRPVQRASIGRSRATARPGSCPHPTTHRRGAICTACGRPVDTRRL